MGREGKRIKGEKEKEKIRERRRMGGTGTKIINTRRNIRYKKSAIERFEYRTDTSINKEWDQEKGSR